MGRSLVDFTNKRICLEKERISNIFKDHCKSKENGVLTVYKKENQYT